MHFWFPFPFESISVCMAFWHHCGWFWRAIFLYNTIFLPALSFFLYLRCFIALLYTQFLFSHSSCTFPIFGHFYFLLVLHYDVLSLVFTGYLWSLPHSTPTLSLLLHFNYSFTLFFIMNSFCSVSLLFPLLPLQKREIPIFYCDLEHEMCMAAVYHDFLNKSIVPKSFHSLQA